MLNLCEIKILLKIGVIHVPLLEAKPENLSLNDKVLSTDTNRGERQLEAHLHRFDGETASAAAQEKFNRRIYNRKNVVSTSEHELF